ncbi:hypothetical protein CALVIDRAFT_567192 [Calocera viscosa TUFC12733]|uniref:Uncharacterized protein n=1 Tax=Calocera viscosa (strain TUFC12733) TaxID=1330018 RepID=A0A167IJL5_CALVF|nr:hypothetical protein CALVIDRAFT_567192 [Calocera viscosa TUFC12733]
MSNTAQTAAAAPAAKPTSAPPPQAKPAPKPAKPIPIAGGQNLLNGPAATKPHRRPARSEDGRYLRSEEEERRGRSRDVRPLR